MTLDPDSHSTLLAGADQNLRSVVPGNGEELTESPTEVVLTFASEVADDASATVTTPDGATSEPEVEASGNDLVVDVPDAGPGRYEVEYTLGDLVGSTGYTVLEPGQDPTPQPAGSAGALMALVLGLAIAGVVAMTLLRWRRG